MYVIKITAESSIVARPTTAKLVASSFHLPYHDREAEGSPRKTRWYTVRRSLPPPTERMFFTRKCLITVRRSNTLQRHPAPQKQCPSALVARRLRNAAQHRPRHQAETQAIKNQPLGPKTPAVRNRSHGRRVLRCCCPGRRWLVSNLAKVCTVYRNRRDMGWKAVKVTPGDYIAAVGHQVATAFRSARAIEIHQSHVLEHHQTLPYIEYQVRW